MMIFGNMVETGGRASKLEVCDQFLSPPMFREHRAIEPLPRSAQREIATAIERELEGGSTGNDLASLRRCCSVGCERCGIGHVRSHHDLLMRKARHKAGPGGGMVRRH